MNRPIWAKFNSSTIYSLINIYYKWDEFPPDFICKIWLQFIMKQLAVSPLPASVI